MSFLSAVIAATLQLVAGILRPRRGRSPCLAADGSPQRARRSVSRQTRHDATLISANAAHATAITAASHCGRWSQSRGMVIHIGVGTSTADSAASWRTAR